MTKFNVGDRVLYVGPEAGEHGDDNGTIIETTDEYGRSNLLVRFDDRSEFSIFPEYLVKSE